MDEIAHIAVASALSPRFRAVLAEAWRFSQLFGVRFSVIHAGGQSAEKEEQFRSAFADLGIPAETSLLWREGDPAETIAALAAENEVDLLIAGALEHDAEKHFLGDVTRQILQRLHCSLLLYPKPKTEPQPFRKIVAITDYSEESRSAIVGALFVAEQENVEVLHVVTMFSPFAAARAQLGADDNAALHEGEEQARIESFLSFVEDSPVPVDGRVIHSTTGMAASDFTKEVEADLLVVAATELPQGGTELPTNMNWVTQVIPCSLWIVKRRAQG